jgi:nitrogen-specific signal transduction histidine kinase
MNDVGTADFLPIACRPGPESPDTHFAPAGREPHDEICRKGHVIQSTPLLMQALDAMPNMVVVLNGHRQIVAANASLLTVLNATRDQVMGKRPGEAVGCIRAEDGPDGCGTSAHCVTCGAVSAILDCQTEGKQVVRECRVLVNRPAGTTALDLRVTAAPLQVGEDRLVVAAVEDISHAKRLAVLQRTFFHDVLNTAGCIQGYTQCLADALGKDREICGVLNELAAQLIDSIVGQRDLIQAETGDLGVQPAELRSRAVLDHLRLQYRKHSVAVDREIQLGTVWDGVVITDRQLLARVLGNMLKNALEATAPGNAVTLGCKECPAGVTFSVHNLEVIPPEAQLQIFQRSFSTKGEAGRGIGTYSMKLFGERYLGGKVDFTSQSPQGTTFTLTIPKLIP